MKKQPKFIFILKKDGLPYRYMVRYSIDGFKKYVGCFKTESQAMQALERSLAREITDPARLRDKRLEAGLDQAKNTL